MENKKNVSVSCVTENQTMINIAGRCIDLNSLKSKAELLEYFQKNGPTHTALMDFCEEYRSQYNNELCWPYPISDGKHLGTFLVLVREGILSLPYDDADKVDYELFCVDDMKIFDADSMEIFIQDWNCFHQDLWQALSDMQMYLQKKKGHYEEKN